MKQPVVGVGSHDGLKLADAKADCLRAAAGRADFEFTVHPRRRSSAVMRGRRSHTETKNPRSTKMESKV